MLNDACHDGFLIPSKEKNIDSSMYRRLMSQLATGTSHLGILMGMSKEKARGYYAVRPMRQRLYPNA